MSEAMKATTWNDVVALMTIANVSYTAILMLLILAASPFVTKMFLVKKKEIVEVTENVAALFENTDTKTTRVPKYGRV